MRSRGHVGRWYHRVTGGHACPRSVLVVSPTPPPSFGMSVLTPGLLAHLRRTWHVYHVDTADRRSLSTIGRFDATNALLAIKHGVQFLTRLLLCWPDVAYLPIAQNRLGFLRDALFLVPARLTGRRVVVHLHGSQLQDFFHAVSRPEKALIRFCIAHACRAVVLGESLRGAFHGLLPQERVRVVWNGVPDHGRPPVSTAGSQGRLVLYLGALLAEKGFFDVLEAAHIVRAESPDVRFVFAGGWARGERDRAEAERIVRRDGLEDTVTFVGSVDQDEKRRLLAEAQVFVFPPVWKEGQSLVVLEALSASLPVVITRSGALSETISHGVEGLFVEPGSPSEIAQAILRIFSDDALRLRMGTAARSTYDRRYALESWHRRLEAVLVEALDC